MIQSQIKSNQFTYFCNKWALVDFAINLFIPKLVFRCKTSTELAAGGQLVGADVEISLQKQSVPEILNKQCAFRNTGQR